MDIKSIIGLPIDDQVTELRKASITTPTWSNLSIQLDPLKHSIYNTVLYPVQANNNGVDDFKRVGLGMQKLAVKRLSQSLFSTPVRRIYTYDQSNAVAKEAVAILENVIKNELVIDQLNTERSKSLFSACHIANIVYITNEEMIVNGVKSNKKINIKYYSDDKGYTLYPCFDENDKLERISIFSIDLLGVQRLITYTAELIIKYKAINGKWFVEDSQSVSFMSATYLSIKDPAWGGQSGTEIVEQLEELLAYQGYYIARNSIPTFCVNRGKLTPGSKQSTAEEDTDDDKRFIIVGEGGSVTDVTWVGATEAIKEKQQYLTNQFWDLIQVADISYSKLLSSNTSADNKELVLADSKSNAYDLAGEFVKLFYDENKIIKKYLKVLFPMYAEQFDNITIRTEILPFSVKSNSENADYIFKAGSSMSLETRIRILGEVDDVETEAKLIRDESKIIV